MNLRLVRWGWLVATAGAAQSLYHSPAVHVREELEIVWASDGAAYYQPRFTTDLTNWTPHSIWLAIPSNGVRAVQRRASLDRGFLSLTISTNFDGIVWLPLEHLTVTVSQRWWQAVTLVDLTTNAFGAAATNVLPITVTNRATGTLPVGWGALATLAETAVQQQVHTLGLTNRPVRLYVDWPSLDW